jgi:hypothetical protein
VSRKKALLSVLLLKLLVTAALLAIAGGVLAIDVERPQSLLAIIVGVASVAGMLYAGGNAVAYVNDFEKRRRAGR